MSEPSVQRRPYEPAPASEGEGRPTQPEGVAPSGEARAEIEKATTLVASHPPPPLERLDVPYEPEPIAPMPPTLTLGSLVAERYRLVRVLGEGGMGTVYEAERLELGKRVAIKVLLPALASSSEANRRFMREARAVAHIDSENIVQVFDVGEDAKHGLYMVMELLKGESAATLLERQGRLSVHDAAALAFQVCNALESAHSVGIVHRDLKVANVFLQRIDANTTRIRVLDFGIAKLLDNERFLAAETLTRSGVILGTPQYMAPEQIEGHEVDRRADLYGLGALLYECLTGKAAYGAVPYQRMLLDILTKPPPRPSASVPGLPPAIDDLVVSLMARLPSQRPSSAAEVQSILLSVFPNLQDYRPRFARPADSHGPQPARKEQSDAPVAGPVRARSSPPSKAPSRPPPSAHERITQRHGPRSMSSPGLFGLAIVSAAALLLVGAWSFSKARAPAAAAVAHEPRVALLQRGRIAIADGAPALAVELARGAIQEDASDAQGWLLLGAAYEALQNRNAAHDAYRDCAAKAKGFRANECADLARR